MAKHGKGIAAPRPHVPRDLTGHVKTLGLTLALLRNLRGKTQAQAAQAAGLETAQLDRFERGLERPDVLETLPRLLRALPATEEDFRITWDFFERRARNYAPGPRSRARYPRRKAPRRAMPRWSSLLKFPLALRLFSHP
jgi:transcriptional regulator with XRE-family HTH domain